MMPGMIMLWYGSIETIPSGWHLCDGTMGTPDLRDMFVPCAGTSYTPGQTGGTVGHTHPFSANPHRHRLSTGSVVQTGVGKDDYMNYETVTGETDSEEHIPPYHALPYIMKIN